jgi:arginine/lysine/ornithine decarboxylase
MNSGQYQTPLTDRLRTSAQSDNVPFHTPGHHKGQGIDPKLKTWWGEAIFRADLPELPELDNLFAPNGIIAEAQTLAAEAWGSDRTFFLTNGSTAGVIASILAVCNPGDSVLVPRNVHRSVISGLILSGANPVFMMPEYDEQLGIAHGVTVDTIANHLASNPKIKAVLIVNPTYYGVCSDVVTIANLTHQYDLPLIVDEAHGAHFQFHSALPTAALSAGADIVIQSTHKTLSALTQASMLHMKGDRVSADRLAKSLQLVQSTSPSYLLLASLDTARMQMVTQGEILLGEAIDRVQRVRSEINNITNITTLEFTHRPGFHELDPLRITVLISGIDGFTADEILHEELGITCELPGLQSLTFISTHGTIDADCDRLLTGLQELSDRILEPHNNSFNYELFTEIPTIVLSPRDAFFAKSKLVTVSDAIGLISADLICPYPPGIPIVMPGEQITENAIVYLQQIVAAGGVLTGCSDGDLQIMRVIDN